ncbi:major facilitator superfamily transporter [Diaporthe sp. PMI_573]|nr:major facilitator superfamily transporter [Diaporthaceae sp. PMI_573]
MLALSLISFMVALDACIIVTSLNAIVLDLGLDTTTAFWIGTSYLLSNAVTMPFTAELSNIFGRPVVLLASLAFFTGGTLLCCLARSIAVLLAGRSLQGIGGGGILVLSLIIFTDMVPLRWRPKWYGSVLGAWALGNCLGPVVGGVIVQDTSWRWVFYIMFPFCFVGSALVLWLLKFRAPPATALQKMQRVDWPGGALFISSATSFLVAVSWGGSQFNWASPQTLVPFCLGALGMAGTFFYEANYAQRPFLRPSLFWNVSSIATYTCGLIQGLVIYGQLYYIPFYFQSVKGYGGVITGVAILPVMITLVPSSIGTGAVVTRTGRYRWPIRLGWILLTVSSGLTMIFDRATPIAAWVVILIALGFGHGAVLNAQNFAAQAMCMSGREGQAAAMYAFLRQFGMTLGVVIGGTIFQNIMSIKLRSQGLSTDIALHSEAFLVELARLPANSDLKNQILDAYVYGLSGLYLFFTCMSAIAFLLSLLIREFEMQEEVRTDHVLQRVSIFELS